MAEATIDELRIEIESDAAQASTSLEDLCAALELLREPVSALTRSNSGLDKLAKQIQKLIEISNAVSQISGFEQLEKAVQSLKALEQLQGAGDVSSYVKAIRKLADSKDAFAAIQNIPDVSRQITSIATALSGLSGLQDINITPIINALNKLPDVVTRINAMPPIDRSRIRGLISVLDSFRNVNTRDISSFTRALGRLPTIAANVQNIDLTSFGQQIEQLANALEPLTSRMESAAGGLQAMTQLLNNSANAQNANNRFGVLGRTLGNLRLSSLLSWASLKKLYGILQDCFNISSQYVENLNLFSVTMGEATDSAMEFAEAVNEALGVDTSDWVRYQGFFQSVSKGFGVASNKAQLMSQNLTQLSYDISSFYNLSVDEAYNKVQSGFAGELEPLRRLGFALDEATLKQVAFNHGITQSLDSMTQAQKSQLRYVAMIEQATAIGVTGDMSRTIDSASNGMRVLTARIQQFQRAVGNMLMPALSAILPYLTAFVQVLTEGAQYLADMFGFELPKFDFSDVSNGYKDIEEATNAATAANEKFKGSLAGVDQLNIIGKHTETSGTGTGSAFDLDINLPSYDFLNGVESKTKEIAENIKKWFVDALPWIEAVGAAIGSFALSQGFINGMKTLSSLKLALAGLSNKIAPVSVALAAAASSGFLLFDSIKNLIKGVKNSNQEWGKLAAGIGIAGAAIVGFIALGNPVGAVITGIGAAIGAIVGYIEGENEKIREQNRIFEESVLYNNGGDKITDIATAYGKWADAAIRVNKATIDKYSQLDSYSGKTSELLGALKELDGLNPNFSDITPASIDELKEPFTELCGYLETEFKERTQAAAESVKNAFVDLGLGKEISKQFEEAYSKLDTLLNDNLSSAQRTVTEYMSVISNGGQLTDEQMFNLEKEYKYIIDMATIENSDYRDFQELAKNINQFDFSNPDLVNSTEALSAVNELKDKFKNYMASQDEALKAEIMNYDMLRDRLKLDLSAGKITQSEYKENLDLIDTSEKISRIQYRTSAEDFINVYSKIMSGVEEKIREASRGVMPDIWQQIMGASGAWTPANVIASLATGQGSTMFDFDENAKAIAQSAYLAGNEAYQSVQSGWNDYKNYSEPLKIYIDTDSAYNDILETIAKASGVVELAVKNGGAYSENNLNEGISMDAASATRPNWAETMLGAARNNDSNKFYGGYTPSGGIDANINVFSTIELDGEVVGECATRYQQNLAYSTNGR